MNNLSSYCGLVDAKIGASDKDLTVLIFIGPFRRAFIQIEWCGIGGPGSAPGVGLNLLYLQVEKRKRKKNKYTVS